MSTAPSTAPTIDIESPVFAMRFANLLRMTRLERGASFRSLVKAGGQQWSKGQLKQIEEGLLTLDESIVESVAMAYGADLESILPTRLAVAIAAEGVISAGGVKAVFIPRDVNSLLTAYLRLIRSMRRQRKTPMITLRRDDIDIIAAHLDLPGETVIDRLTALMGATLNQRTAIAAMFATGALVIGLAGATVAGPIERGPVAATDQGASSALVSPSTADAPAINTPTDAAITDPVVATTTSIVDPSAIITNTETVAVVDPLVEPTSAPTPGAAPAPATSTLAVVSTPPSSPPSSPPSGATAAEPPLVPEAPAGPTPDATAIVATDDPPVPPTTSIVSTGDPVVPAPGSAEPPILPSPDTTTTTTVVVDVGAPPVPGG